MCSAFLPLREGYMRLTNKGLRHNSQNTCTDANQNKRTETEKNNNHKKQNKIPANEACRGRSSFKKKRLVH